MSNRDRRSCVFSRRDVRSPEPSASRSTQRRTTQNTTKHDQRPSRDSSRRSSPAMSPFRREGLQSNSRMNGRDYRMPAHRKEPQPRRHSRHSPYAGFNGNTQNRQPPAPHRRPLLATPPPHRPPHRRPFFRHARPPRARPAAPAWRGPPRQPPSTGGAPGRQPAGPPHRAVDYFEHDDFSDHPTSSAAAGGGGGALRVKAERPSPRVSRWGPRTPPLRRHETEPISEDELAAGWGSGNGWNGEQRNGRKRDRTPSPVTNDVANHSLDTSDVKLESLQTDDEDSEEGMLYIDTDSPGDQLIDTADAAQTPPATERPAPAPTPVPSAAVTDSVLESVEMDLDPGFTDTPLQVVEVAADDLASSTVDSSGPSISPTDQDRDRPDDADLPESAHPETGRLLSDISISPDALISPASPVFDGESDMESDVFLETRDMESEVFLETPAVQPIIIPLDQENARLFRKKARPVRRRASSCPPFEPDEQMPLEPVKKDEEDAVPAHPDKTASRPYSPVSEVGDPEPLVFSPQLIVPHLSQLDSYVFPQISSDYFILDPLHTARALLTSHPALPPAGVSSAACVFIEALDRLNSDTVAPSEYEMLISSLMKNIQCSLEYFNWFSPSDPPHEQLGVQFLHAMKSLLHDTRNLSNQSSPLIKCVLELLWTGLLKVNDLSEYLMECGVLEEIVDVAGGKGGGTVESGLAVGLIEAFIVLVQRKEGLLGAGNRMRRNAGGLGGMGRGGMGRVLGLWEMRMSVQGAVEIGGVGCDSGSGRNMAAVMKAWLDGIYSALSKIISKIIEYRHLHRDLHAAPSHIDGHAAVFACLDRAKFLPWLAGISEHMAKLDQRDITVWKIRKLICDLLELLIHNELGAVYLLSKPIRKHTKTIFNGLLKHNDLESLRTAQKISAAMETIRCLDTLLTHSDQNPTETLSDLASLVQVDTTSSTAVNILTGKHSQALLKTLMEKPLEEPVGRVLEVIVNGVIYQRERGTFLVEFIGELAQAYGGKVNAVRYCALTCAGVLGKAFREEESKSKFFRWVVGELSQLQSEGAKVPDSIIYVLLDTCVYCLSFCFKSLERISMALKTSNAMVFVNLLKSMRIVIESSLISMIQPHSPQLNIQLWESAWINSAKVFALCVLAGVIPVPLALQIFVDMVSFSCRAEVPVSEGCRTAVQQELARGLKEIVRQTLSAVAPAALVYSALYQNLYGALCAASDIGQPLAAMWAYVAIVNRLRPDHLHSAADMVSDEWIRRRNNWEALVRLDFSKLKRLICFGLSTSVPYADAHFRLWFWHYCEMSAPAAYEAVSMLWWTVCTAIKDGLSEESLAGILQKLAAFLRLDVVRTVSLYLLQPPVEGVGENGPLELIENPVGWHPRMFDYFITLLASCPLYTKNTQQPYLHLTVQIIANLLPPLSTLATHPTLDHHVPTILSTVLSRLETDPSVPLIATVSPLFQCLPYYPEVFCRINQKKPILNRILLTIARELKTDEVNGELVGLGKKIVEVFKGMGTGRKIGWAELREMAGMVVAFTRGYNHARPTFRLIQNVDPERVVMPDGEHAAGSVVREFVQIIRKMLVEFAHSDAGKGKEKKDKEPEGGATAKEMVEWFRTYVEEVGAIDGEAYERWQRQQIDKAVHMDQAFASYSQPLVLISDSMHIEKMLYDWMQRKSGLVATCSSTVV